MKDLQEALALFNNEDYKEAFKAFSELALNKEKEAYYYMGYLYEKGLGVKANTLQAILWYKNGMQENDLKATFSLAKLYYKNKDYEEALDILNKIDNIDSILLQAIIYKEINNKEKYYETLLKGQKYNDLKITYKLALYYYDHKDKKAIPLFLDCALNGRIKALNFLGEIYYYGYGVDVDYNLAFKYLKEAFENELYDDTCLLAKLYYYGLGIKQDKIKAHQILDIGLTNNDIKSILFLGDIRVKSQNKDELYLAKFMYEKASLLNSSEGLYKLGLCYENGIGTKKDLDKAYECYEKAKNLNYEQASIKLNEFSKNIFGHIKYNN